MNILLFGATGRVGLSAMEYALVADHHVTAVVRNRAKIQQTHPHLDIVEGDIYKAQELFVLVQSQRFDVLMNVVGGNVFKTSTVVTDSVQAALTVMEQGGITRYLGITGVAEMQSAGLFATLTDTALHLSPIRAAVRDHDKAFALVKTSNTIWTLAGCPYIRDGQHTANYKVVPDVFPGGFKTISPQDVADFLVKEVQQQRFPQQIIGIWN